MDETAAAPQLTPPEALTARDAVAAFEAQLRGYPQLTLTVRHWFAPGIYARELMIPAGTLLTGKIHKAAHLCIMSAGDMEVLTEGGIVRVKAPFTLVSPPGTKRIALAHADTVWTTIHPSTETDLDKLEAELIAESEDDYQAFLLAQQAPKCLS
ncbi:MAG TPA: hypothetical protein VKX28_26850 [Xanthobacteraceae bacterium]|nr:hypothetical protein [Xanthobacteraceae bacterium]